MFAYCPFQDHALLPKATSKSLSKSTIVDSHTRERSLKKWISTEREHLLHHDYDLSTASLKKFAMPEKGSWRQRREAEDKGDPGIPIDTLLTSQSREGGGGVDPDPQPQRKPPTVAMETPSKILFQQSSNFVAMSSLFDLTMANLQKFKGI
ncbi:hypothetical protein M378DRAFT_162104, partial [Amanita muscaria Koide BX008]